ncbi:plasmid mobilization relaxosome protein MobC [Kineococcus sp. SYSU DK005]|uniref:plasmid mobilization relaxosome protein MobC n=1 Tax=Kineococcus sp. SYSU DK005 TaxID=3383126 RepID=UPI003D7D00A1
MSVGAGASTPLRLELARVGSNLNQAVRLAHAHGLDAAAAARIEVAAAEVRQVLRALHEQAAHR